MVNLCYKVGGNKPSGKAKEPAMSRLSGGQKVVAPSLSGGGTDEARFVRMERKVQGGRWVTLAVVRYHSGGAEFSYAPHLVTCTY
jgi:hypothetical protein